MIIKAGTIVIKDDLIAMIYRDYYDDYTFPKGHLEIGETILECAIRETEEETKISVEVLDKNPIYIQKYKNKNDELCECTYYLAKYKGKSDNKSLEVHDLMWINFEDVYDKLTFDSDKVLWNSIRDTIKKYMVK